MLNRCLTRQALDSSIVSIRTLGLFDPPQLKIDSALDARASAMERLLPIKKPLPWQWLSSQLGSSPSPDPLPESRDQTPEIGVQEHLVINFSGDAPYVALTSLESDPKMWIPITLARLH